MCFIRSFQHGKSFFRYIFVTTRRISQSLKELKKILNPVIFYSLGFVHIARVGSIYTTVSITIERYLSIQRPQTSDDRFKSVLVVFPIFFAIAYNIPRFFELEATVDGMGVETIEVLNDSITLNNSKNSLHVNNTTIVQNCTLNTTYIVEDVGYQGTRMRQHPLYIVLYIFWSKFLFIELIPWCTVFVLNLLIWEKVREFERIRRTSLGIHNGTILNRNS